MENISSTVFLAFRLFVVCNVCHPFQLHALPSGPDGHREANLEAKKLRSSLSPLQDSQPTRACGTRVRSDGVLVGNAGDDCRNDGDREVCCEHVGADEGGDDIADDADHSSDDDDSDDSDDAATGTGDVSYTSDNGNEPDGGASGDTVGIAGVAGVT